MNKKSSLLIKEPPLSVLPSLAVKIGLDEAIVLQQLHYWLTNSKNEGRVDENGEKWVYNTYAQWREDNFPFWSEDKIQRIFLSLEKKGLIISRQLDAKRRDMTKFYRLAWDEICALDDSFLRPSNTANLHDVKMNQRLPETTTTGFSQTDEEQGHYSTAYGRGEQERPDKVAEWMKMANMPGLKEQAKLDALLSAFGEAFTVNTETSEWKKLAKYAISEQKLKGYDPQVFIEWVKRQKGYPEFWSCKRMLTEYPRAFVQNDKDEEKLRML